MSHPKTLTCPKHGKLSWKGHVGCRACGAAYTTHDDNLSTHLTYRCKNPACKKRIKPHPHKPVGDKSSYFGIYVCSACFEEAARITEKRDGHERGDPACAGLECSLHGPMLRKLARRAARAGHTTAQEKAT
jgi:DNA-directed RNA polymerase subunit RPC12/RpoP